MRQPARPIGVGLTRKACSSVACSLVAASNSNGVIEMGLSRRGFFAGLGGVAGVAASAWMQERIAFAAPETLSKSRVARILFNENPLGPSPAALKAIETYADQFNRYGMTEALRLEMKLRAKMGLPTIEVSDTPALGPAPRPDSETDVALAIGSSEVLRAAAWMCADLGGGKGNVVEHAPTFDALGSEAAEKPGAKLVRKIVPLDQNDQIDFAAMAAAIDKQTQVVAICNPNNPTGGFHPKPWIAKFLDRVPETCLVLIDEAYIEYIDNYEEHSALELAKSRPNVLVTRTFSKIYGLAGLRLGYAVGHRSIIARLRSYLLGGLALNAAALAAATAALDDVAHVEATRALNRKVQERWKRELPELGFKVRSGGPGFIWADAGEDCTGLVRSLQQRGVLISHGRRWDLPNYVRISIGTDEEIDRLMEGIKAYRG